MTVVLASLKANLERETRGDWEEYHELPGVRFKVSSIHLPSYTIARDLLFQKLVRQYKKTPVPEDVKLREVGALFAKHLLHDWDGLDIAYSPETALEVLTDPAYRIIIRAVEWCAGAIADVDVKFVEDAGKNSDAPSESV